MSANNVTFAGQRYHFHLRCIKRYELFAEHQAVIEAEPSSLTGSEKEFFHHHHPLKSFDEAMLLHGERLFWLFRGKSSATGSSEVADSQQIKPVRMLMQIKNGNRCTNTFTTIRRSIYVAEMHHLLQRVTDHVATVYCPTNKS